MRLVKSEEQNPQDYFLQSGVDEQGDPIYKDVNQEVTDYAPAKAFRKKVFDGTADIVVLSNTIQIYWKGNLVAEAQLEGQVEISPNNWQGQLFSFADSNVQKITEIETDEGTVPVTPFFRCYVVKDIPALGITDAVFGMDVHWAFKNTKLSFYLDTPGFNARIRWQCRVKDSALRWVDESDPLFPVVHKGLWFSVSDYEGNVNHGSQGDPEPGWTQHWWTFEPDGKQIDVADARTPLERYEQGVGLVVDPYLSIEESGSTVTVYCDGFSILFDPTETGGLNCDNNSATTWNYYYPAQVVVSSGVYNLGYDPNSIIEIIESNANRVVLRFRGNFYNSTPTVLTNSDSIEIYLYIYSDRIVQHSKWITSGGNISIDSNGQNGFPMNYIGSGVLTNDTAIYENGGSESTGTGEHGSADYVGIDADELDHILINLSESSTGGSLSQYHSSTRQYRIGWDNCTIEPGTHEIVNVWIFDTEDREGSTKIYDSTDRLAMGDQYKDAILDQSPSKGDDVTDMILPARISSGTLHSDGAHHYEVDTNDAVKLTLDTTRIRPAFAIHDWPFQYGTVASPTDILLCHLKCDENAASPTLTDQTANNADGTWSNISDGSDRNTNTSGDSVQVFGRGRNLDTQDGAGHIEMTFGSGTVHDNAFFCRGSLMIKLLPQFDYDTVDGQGLFELYISSDDYFTCIYNPTPDNWNTGGSVGGSAIWQGSAPQTYDNYSLKRCHVILFSWDLLRHEWFIFYDGVCAASKINTGTAGSGDPVNFEIGSRINRTYPADIIIDDVKTFSECLLPFGAYFIGNGEGLLADINNPHADLTFFWDCQASGAGAAKGGANLGTNYTVTLNGSGVLTTADKIIGTKSFDTTAEGSHSASFSIDANNFDGSYGRIGMWVNFQTVTASKYFLGFGDATDYIDLYISASSYFYAIWQSDGVTRYLASTLTPTAGVWYWVELAWDDSDYIDFYVNGILLDHEDSGGSWSKTTGTMYLGADESGANSADCLIGAFYITKDRFTPQIWTAFGKPLHVPLVDLQ